MTDGVDIFSEETLNSLMGRSLQEWFLKDDGIHFTPDDGKTLIIAGRFALAVLIAEEQSVH